MQNAPVSPKFPKKICQLFEVLLFRTKDPVSADAPGGTNPCSTSRRRSAVCAEARFKPVILATALMAVASGAGLRMASAQIETTLELTANNIQHAVRVQLPAQWSVAPATFTNARNLIDMGPGAAAQIQIYVEPRVDHADALKQIVEAAATVPDDAKVVVAIGGWPAVRITQPEVLPQPSQGRLYPNPEVLRVKVYIAVGGTLFVATGTLPADASPALVQTVVDITSSLKFAGTSNAQQLNQDLELLRASGTPAKSAAPSGGTPSTALEPAPSGSGLAGPGATVGPNIRVDTTNRGELEIAVSPDNLNVVLALQGRAFTSSNDGGATFPNSGTIGAGNGDPSVAYGQSGAFYVAWIDTGCGSAYLNPVVAPDLNPPPGPDPSPFGLDCTGIARSTDNGATFPTNAVNPAVVCIAQDPSGVADPLGSCFPDQEHIAADRFNPGINANADQIYSTWRNFDATGQPAGLVCSQDSGATWTAPITLGANSSFPRITVGQDGFVYVAAYGGGNYRLWKYSSCANGLNLQAGFPVNVTARTPYACPFPGHDRCDQNPSSQTVAVDDTNPNHIYYAYAQDDAEGTHSYSTVFVRDSADGGLTWPAARVVQASAATNARRIMPWMCATQGDAVVTWYEQASPLPPNAGGSDATHHVAAEIGLDGGGNLTNRDVFTISANPDNWCNSGWPCGTRVAPGASDSCPNQPQLAGFCGDNIAGTPDSGIRCDFSDEAAVPGTYCPQPFAGSGNNEICLGGNGCPKYGDYNGNACIGLTLHAAWPSAAAPGAPATATNTGVIYSNVTLVGPCVNDGGDADIDGVCDDFDACLGSIVGGNVVVDGCDSGVANAVGADGCTINDQVADVTANTNNDRQFTRAMRRLLRRLFRSGAITRQEEADIRNCL